MRLCPFVVAAILLAGCGSSSPSGGPLQEQFGAGDVIASCAPKMGPGTTATFGFTLIENDDEYVIRSLTFGHLDGMELIDAALLRVGEPDSSHPGDHRQWPPKSLKAWWPEAVSVDDAPRLAPGLWALYIGLRHTGRGIGWAHDGVVTYETDGETHEAVIPHVFVLAEGACPEDLTPHRPRRRSGSPAERRRSDVRSVS